MKKTVLLFLLFLVGTTLFAQRKVMLFAYTPEKRAGAGGLNFAWSGDGENWNAIGPEYDFLKSDYGRWGQEKKMHDPFLFQDQTGLWHCVWTLNDYDGAFGYASSTDLVKWGRQSYPLINEGGNCKMMQLCVESGKFTFSWIDTRSKTKFDRQQTTTTDFKNYSSSTKITPSTLDQTRKTLFLRGKLETGTIHEVHYEVIEQLIKGHQVSQLIGQQNGETTAQDAIRFANLKSVEATIQVDFTKSKPISDKLVGIFFEDINYAADGGLYAELIQNRGFEYALSDKEGRDRSWKSDKAWSVNPDLGLLTIDSIAPIHENNSHYAVLQMNKKGAGLINEGFDGIAIAAGELYDFSFFVRSLEAKKGPCVIRLIGKQGELYGQTTSKMITSDWKKQTMVIKATQTVADARLEIVPQMTGKVNLDLISLFPQKTFKGRKNGLRIDLANCIAALKPQFVRFPGGCLVHGDGIENMYHWKQTVGSLESRTPKRNSWGYHQTGGLGYFEYFQFCEDLGAIPIPVVAAGVPCQNSAHQHHALGGQQGGIPMSEMDAYVQDVLDLVEWANGDKNSKWGKIRAQAGHPEPFQLKYIGVGNEDLITDLFEERFTLIFNALKEKHPEIKVIGTAGPFIKTTTDYVEGWKIADQLALPMIDEHYYQSPGWFINNQDYYDSYDRSKSKVYLGEYAAHLAGRPNLETALSEALYLTSIERNGDVVEMTSYAPLLAKEEHIQWGKDLIYFTNTEINPTVGYYVQKMFGENSGQTYIDRKITLSNQDHGVEKRIGVSAVTDQKTGDLILKLVNLLPVEVAAKMDWGSFPQSTSAIKTVLKGNPDDRILKPTVSTISIPTLFVADLPPYSFTVLRIKMQDK